MAQPKVQITRPEEQWDIINLNFNEEAYKLVRGKPIMFEETKDGILLTVPIVDHHNSTRITFKNRFTITTEAVQDFEDGEWCPINEIDSQMFLIKVQWI